MCLTSCSERKREDDYDLFYFDTSASIGDTEEIFEGTENEGVGVKNYAGKTFYLFFYTSLTNSLLQAWLSGMIP